MKKAGDSQQHHNMKLMGKMHILKLVHPLVKALIIYSSRFQLIPTSYVPFGHFRHLKYNQDKKDKSSPGSNQILQRALKY